jgi:hypothetical protein
MKNSLKFAALAALLSGFVGCSATEKSTGATGDQGSPGVQGPRGLQGDKGDKGEPGANGKNGADGVDGVDGKTTLFAYVDVTSTAVCPTGGYVLASGYDTNDNGELDAVVVLEPAVSEWYELTGQPCNVDEDDALVNCVDGQVQITHPAVSAVLGTEFDIDNASPPVCNGLNGSTGPTGATGPVGVPGVQGDAGPAGPAGDSQFIVSVETFGPTGPCSAGGSITTLTLDVNLDGVADAHELATLSTDFPPVCNAFCGDNIQDENEACDDGVALNVNTLYSTIAVCTTSCVISAFCGDGVISGPFEVCDTNGASPDVLPDATIVGSSCNATCTVVLPPS